MTHYYEIIGFIGPKNSSRKTTGFVPLGEHDSIKLAKEASEEYAKKKGYTYSFRKFNEYQTFCVGKPKASHEDEGIITQIIRRNRYSEAELKLMDEEEDLPF